MLNFNMLYVYILQSLSYNTYYVGSSKDADRRLKEHNAGKCRYTSGRMPWRLVYKEEYGSRGEAIRRERFIKSGHISKFLEKKLSSFATER